MSNLGSVGNSASFSPPEEKKEEKKSEPEEFISELDMALADASAYFGSRETSEHTQALKILLSMMSKGYDVSSFAPLVIQECASSDVFGRQLAYIYLNHYADDALESIVLSVNTFQRSLSDQDPICRALALKTLSSIRSNEVMPVIKDTIQQVIGDTSPFVRKAAAYSIVKYADLSSDDSEVEEMLPALERLLNDDDPICFSGAIAAYWALCPDNVEFLHKRFRYMCHNMSRFDPWGQVYALRSLTVYARYCFKNPTKKEEDEAETVFWDDNDETESIQADHLLLIQTAKRAMQEQNPAVVLAAVSLIFYCAPPSHISCIARPLVRLLYEKPATVEVALATIASIASVYPLIFIPHIYHFYVRINDKDAMRESKLHILEELANATTLDSILKELTTYASSSNIKFASLAIKSIGKIAKNPSATPNCLSFLLKLLGSTEGKILSEAVLAVSQIIKQNRGTEDEAVALKQLCRKFLVIKDPSARAAVLCIVGDMHKVHKEFAPQLLRYIGKNFTSEPPEVRLMAITLAAKVIAVGTDSKVPLYVIQLGERDAEFDVRDRAKFFKALVGTKSEKMQAKLAEILYPATKAQESVEAEKEEEYQIGTLSHLLQRELDGYEGLPEWAPENELPDDSVRYPNGVPEEGNDEEEEDGDEKDNIKQFFSDDDDQENAEYEEEENREEEEEEEEEGDDKEDDNKHDADHDDEDDFFS